MHRARLLRQDCTVYLFSVFPCEQAEIFVQDYLKVEDLFKDVLEQGACGNYPCQLNSLGKHDNSQQE